MISTTNEQNSDFTQSENLIPKQAYLFFPDSEDIYKQNPKQSNITYRFIFEGSTQLLPHEINKIQQAKSIPTNIFEENKSRWTDGFTYRFLQNKKNTIEEDVKGMEDYNELRNNLVPMNIRDMPEKWRLLLKTGMIYVSGRDQNFRPYIVIRCKMLKDVGFEIDELKKFLTMFLDWIVDEL